jgi:predicted dehydrogenase
VRLKAVCDTNTKLVKGTARGIGHETQWYDDASVMLEMEHLDLVDICVPPQGHFSLAMQAIERGCHVAVEKPTALSLEQAQRMVAAADDRKVKLFVIRQSLFNPVIMKAKNLLQRGALGDLISMEITFLDSPDSWEQWIKDRAHWSHALPGGHFFDALPHPLYIMHAFLGELNVEAVNARKLTNHDWVVADDLFVLLSSKRGAGSIHVGFNSAKPVGYIDIHGTKENLRIFPFSLTSINYKGCELAPLPLAMENLSQSWQMVVGTTKAALTFFSRSYRGGHSIIIPKIVESIRNNTEPPVCLEDVLEVMRALEEICQQIEAMRQRGVRKIV